ncbi:MAG: hypothetical protein JXL84_02130, partial [Deltaproteobacteria bacterium]|nr:hypothetical protein [Deltaproteobacteria bacterium]
MKILEADAIISHALCFCLLGSRIDYQNLLDQHWTGVYVVLNQLICLLCRLKMTRLSKIAESTPAAVEDVLIRLGSSIRIARLRRKLSREQLSERIGISR